MKKKLEEQLKQLAKEIIEKSDFSDLEILQEKTRELYESITVQLYLEQNKSPEALRIVSKAMDSSTFTNTQTEDPVPVEQPTHADNLAEPLIEKIKDIVAQMPKETQRLDDMLDELLLPKKPQENELEQFASQYQQMPTFERKDPAKERPAPAESKPEEPSKLNEIKKPRSLNEKLVKDLKIGLNDRLAFTKHLFNNNVDDYNRVVSQITTLDRFSEVQQFVENQVKPDYNWEGKEPFVERFMSLIEKRFD
tara:strand:- start:149902 stop:150654 length:753 start_codon:yes stop_codon:yes gene_type:complete